MSNAPICQVTPQFLNRLIGFISSEEQEWKGYLYMGLIVAVTLLNTLVNSQTFYIQYLVGLRIKTALISGIYRKSLRLSNVGRKEMSGKFRFCHLIINLLSDLPV